jgi:hypothetical protein
MENVPNATSEEELRRLCDEGKISGDEYQDLLAAMRETSRMDIGPGERATGCFYCFEYVSETKLLGLPLLHIVLGPAWDPGTGRIRLAKGIIAIGGIAIGAVAMGGISVGIIAFGGVALGLAAVGGVALGLGLAIGGLAIGFVALGGGAIGHHAIGGWAWGVRAWGGNARDPQLLEFFKTHFGR